MVKAVSGTAVISHRLKFDLDARATGCQRHNRRGPLLGPLGPNGRTVGLSLGGRQNVTLRWGALFR